MRHILAAFLALACAGAALAPPAIAENPPRNKAPTVAPQTGRANNVNKGDCGHDFHLCPK